MGFRRGITCFKCNQRCPLPSYESELSLLEVRFSQGLVQATLIYVGQASLQMSNLVISLHVWIWRWSLLCLLNKSNNQMSDLLVSSKPWEWQMIFGMNHLPIPWEASHTLHNKYEAPNFYLSHPLYNQNKAHNIS